MIKQVDLSITDHMAVDLQNIALMGMPFEVCGVIHPHNIIHQYPNKFTGDHRHGFDMYVDPTDGNIKSVWHSHPGGLMEPSLDDERAMKQIGALGHTFPWLIVTSKGVTEWVFEPSKLHA